MPTLSRYKRNRLAALRRKKIVVELNIERNALKRDNLELRARNVDLRKRLDVIEERVRREGTLVTTVDLLHKDILALRQDRQMLTGALSAVLNGHHEEAVKILTGIVGGLDVALPEVK